VPYVDLSFLGRLESWLGEGDPYGLPSLPVVAAPDVGGMVETKPNEIEEDEPSSLPANMPIYSKHTSRR